MNLVRANRASDSPFNNILKQHRALSISSLSWAITLRLATVCQMIVGDMAQNDEFTLLELKGRPRKRKQMKKKGLQKEEFSNEALVEYKSYGVPIGKGRNDLRSYIGFIRRVPLELKETLWFHFQKKFNLSLKCKSQVLKWMGVASRNFRSQLTKEFIIPYKDDIMSLRLPPIEYPGIKKEDWKHFVDKILSEEFQKRENGVSEREIDRSEAWLMTQVDGDGKYASEVIVKLNKENSNHMGQMTLGKALQKQPNGSRVQGVGQFITSSMYFHVPNATELARERKMYQENFQFMNTQLEHMNARLNAYSNTEVGSSNYPKPTTGAQFEIDQQSR
ncbi:hypothetical protein CUMW_187920 [Citrus unshiu]|nr:hypothetical protein CUMW_187920 [Citrus unshiu]